MKKTSPLVIALLLTLGNAINLSQHTSTFLNAYYDDVQPGAPVPAVQASPVKTNLKSVGCNADKCPSTGPSCCMVSPDRNMTPGALAKSLVQKDEETNKAKTEEKPAEKKPVDTGKIIPHCCQPHENGNVAGCQGEFNGKAGNAPNVPRLPYCADVEKINTANHVPEEKKEETKKEAPKEEPKETPKEAPKEAAKEAAKEAPKEVAKEAPKELDAPKVLEAPKEGLAQVAPATNPPYINPAPSGSSSSPVKMSIKGKGCTAEPCDGGATRAPCCKVSALAQVAPATNPPYINPAPSGSDSSPVKMTIKGKGCTAQPCDAGATRAPCCKVI